MTPDTPPITTPSAPALDDLCERLAELAERPGAESEWPRESLQWCARYGVFRWFVGKEYGGEGWTADQITQGYLRLSAACLTTTFIITQRTAASRRIEASTNQSVQQRLLPQLASGAIASTVGISHLTTSRQHLTTPVLRAEPIDGGYLIDGFSPWVTGGKQADEILMGATLPDQRQILFILKRDQVDASQPHSLMALTGSSTGAVHVNQVRIAHEDVVGGPVEDVMKSSKGAMTGGLQTSTLAIGLASAAIGFIATEADRRDDLRETAIEFQSQLDDLTVTLLELSRGNPICSSMDLRTEANSLVTRSTQAALVAAKGAGYVTGHRVGRWCREALFFLVWSCPQPVLNANLCELAGVEL